MNAPFGNLAIYAPEKVDDAGDVARALNAAIAWRTGEPRLEKVPAGVEFNMAVIGPALRKGAKGFMQAVEALPADQLQNPPATVIVDGAEVAVPENAFTPKFAYQVEGEAVDVLTIGEVTRHPAWA